MVLLGFAFVEGGKHYADAPEEQEVQDRACRGKGTRRVDLGFIGF